MEFNQQVTKKQHAMGCRHFNGRQNDTCEAGINYDKTFNYNELPCKPSGIDGQYKNHCPLFEYYTPAEIDERDQQTADAALKFVLALADNKCPHCGVDIDRKQKVGRCVYARPCGHRLYQGNLMEGAK